MKEARSTTSSVGYLEASCARVTLGLVTVVTAATVRSSGLVSAARMSASRRAAIHLHAVLLLDLGERGKFRRASSGLRSTPLRTLATSAATALSE